ncbi:MAG TPA: tetratricopeptide repeat protein, partial [Candidatus Krumholzibacteria bacterium]|nr:tetratricopeptide repeat protein [Candidatus Krumholzibacteria bacterium]
VKVVLSTVTSNLRDLPPFDSAHRDGIDDIQRQHIDEAVRTGGVNDLHEALELDSTYAVAHYALAQALESDSTQALAARREFIAARDHDVVHFRACTVFNDIIRQEAGTHHVPLVDMDADFARASARGVPGINLFLEHLHPNLHGAILMARVFREAMQQAGILKAAASDSSRTYEEMIHAACITPLDLELARQRIDAMTGQWPFQRNYAALNTEFPQQPNPTIAGLATAVLHKQMGLDQAHEQLGSELMKRNQLEPALEEYRALAKIYPVSPVGHINIADILLRMHKPAAAIPYYQTGLALDPKAVEPRWRLAFALHAVGDNEAALAECKKVLALQPDHDPTKKLMQRIKSGQ